MPLLYDIDRDGSCQVAGAPLRSFPGGFESRTIHNTEPATTEACHAQKSLTLTSDGRSRDVRCRPLEPPLPDRKPLAPPKGGRVGTVSQRAKRYHQATVFCVGSPVFASDKTPKGPPQPFTRCSLRTMSSNGSSCRGSRGMGFGSSPGSMG